MVFQARCCKWSCSKSHSIHCLKASRARFNHKEVTLCPCRCCHLNFSYQTINCNQTSRLNDVTWKKEVTSTWFSFVTFSLIPPNLTPCLHQLWCHRQKKNTKWLTSTFWALVEMGKWTKVQQSPHGQRQRAAIYVSRRIKTQQLFIFSQFIQVQTHKCIFYVSACQQTLWNVARWAFKCEFSTKEDFPLFFSFFSPLL